MIIQKIIMSQPYYVPLSAHKLVSYTVNIDNDVVTANVASYYNKDAIDNGGQPLAQYSIVIKGKPTENVLEWVGQQLTLTDAERVPNEYNYQAGYQIGDRLMFSGGEVLSDE